MGVLLAAALVVGVAQAAPAQAAPESGTLPQAGYEHASDDAVPVPGGPVTVPSTGVPELVVPAPVLTDAQQAAVDDRRAESAAVAEARQSGERVEIVARTTETSISYAQPDGTVAVETAAGPVRTKVDGEWVPVDTTLEFTGDGVQPKAVTGDITFSDGDPGAAMAVLGNGGDTSLTVGWNGDLPTPVLDGDTATYANVLPQVDLVLTATWQGFS